MKQSKELVKEKQRVWYQKNKKRILAHYRTTAVRRRETTRLWTIKNHSRVRMKERRWKDTEKGRAKAKYDSFIRRFRERGLTLNQYRDILKGQDGRCAICNEIPKTNYGGSHDGFHIDHHHVSGKVRGLLCDTCNVGIGMLKDSAVVCLKAAAYLTSHCS